MNVRTNAMSTPENATVVGFVPKGLGSAITEHMFFNEDRIPVCAV